MDFVKLRIFGKATLYAGILVLAFGALITASVVWDILFTQGLCQGGLSPQPIQGCGYVPEMVLFHWGAYTDYPKLVLGLFVTYAGMAVLVIRWVATRVGLGRESKGKTRPV